MRQTTLSAPDLATILGELSDNAARSGQSLQGSLASIATLKGIFGDTETAAKSFEGMLAALQEKSDELGVQVTDSSGSTNCTTRRPSATSTMSPHGWQSSRRNITTPPPSTS